MLTINRFLVAETFFNRFEERLEDNYASIWEDDLLNLIFLCDGNLREVTLLKRVLAQVEKNASLFGSDYGPTVMRMAYHLNLPEFALKLLDRVRSLSTFNFCPTLTIISLIS